MDRKWYLRPESLVATGVFVLALGVYVATMAPTISFWDCAEYITTSHIVGIPHQPGTPMYVLVGRVFDVLLGSPDIQEPAMRTAWAVNFMSAFFSALAVLLIYLVIVRMARRADPDGGWLPVAGGVVGAIFLVFSETFWNNAIEAEVYGLAAFMMALLTWLALIWYESRTEVRSNWVLLLLVYLFGLGVGFHLGSLLVFPGVFLLVWLSTDRQLPVLDLLLVGIGLALFLASTTFVTDGDVLMWLVALYACGCAARAFWGRQPLALLGLLLFVAGLSVHAMMLIRAGAVPEPAINQTRPDNFATLLSVLRREQYPALNPLERQAPLGFQFGYYYDFLREQFRFLSQRGGLELVGTLIGPIALGLLGLLHGLRRARPVIWLLVVLYLINADGLTLYLNFTDHEVRARDYFYFAAFMYYAVFIGLGVAALLRYTTGPEGPSLQQLETATNPPPPGRPFRPRSFALRVVVAFLLALLCLFFTPESAREAGIAFYLFGLPVIGLGLCRVIDRDRGGDAATAPAWNERPWGLRLALACGLLALAAVAGLVLSAVAVGTDRLFLLICYVALLGGMVLSYGEPRGEPRRLQPVQRPRAVTTGVLPKIAAVLLVVVAAMPLLQPGHRKYFAHDRSDNRIAYEYAHNILAGLDRGAIVFTNGDNDTFPIWYLQEVEHFRRDVTVVNLSLVNLPWYVKQLRTRDPAVPLNYTDAELDALTPKVFRDPQTNEVTVVLVRDYVVRDIIDANRRSADRRPVFFAVTIPRTNMTTYFPFLQMEGLAYRLTETQGEDGMPTTDADRLLANVFGAYELDALLAGDSDERHARFAEAAGWQSDAPAAVNLSGRELPPQVDLEPLLAMVGEDRTDVSRSPNTVNLLGNYPVSIARAGFDYLRQAEMLRASDGGIAPEDTAAYDRLTSRALAAYEMARRFDPDNALVATGYYPMLLLERGKIQETFAYLESLAGNIDPSVEEQAILAAMRGLLTLGRTDDALAWLDARLTLRPDWIYGYDLMFRLYEAEGKIAGCRAVLKRLEEATGQRDDLLRERLQDLENRARQDDQKRLEDAVEGNR